MSLTAGKFNPVRPRTVRHQRPTAGPRQRGEKGAFGTTVGLLSSAETATNRIWTIDDEIASAGTTIGYESIAEIVNTCRANGSACIAVLPPSLSFATQLE